ncbi:MAG: 50S ribosomal protein L18e [Halobacteria archaeon]
MYREDGEKERNKNGNRRCKMTKQNPRLKNLIKDLKNRAEDGAGVWNEVASRLETPTRNRAEVNVSKIDRYADPEEAVVVPGKVLGSGVLSKDVTVAAFDFSSSAEDKIEAADGEPVMLEEFVEDNPEGSDVRVIR